MFETTEAWAVIDAQTQLGRDIRTEARTVVLRLNGPVTREGFVQVRKTDLIALKAALDAEDAWYERNEA